MPTKAQINRVNKNYFLSLSNDFITAEKTRSNINTNPHTLFVAPTNTTVNLINQHVIETLFQN